MTADPDPNNPAPPAAVVPPGEHGATDAGPHADDAPAPAAGPDAMRPRVLPWVVLACTLLSTFAVAYYVWSKDRLRADSAAREAAQAARERIQGRVDGYVSLLRGVAGLFANRLHEGTGRLPATRREFATYVERLDLHDHYPGVQGLGFALRLSADERAGFERAMRRAASPEFRIWDDRAAAAQTAPTTTAAAAAAAGATNAEAFPIVFLEPLDARNRAAVGFDMFSEPVRREAMSRARDTAATAASGVVRLKQEIDEGDRQNGFLLYVPLYHTGAAPPDVAGRRVELAGFAYAPFRAGDLLDGIARDDGQARIEFSVYDGGTLLDRTDAPAAPGSAGVDPRLDTAPADVKRDIDVGGRRWSLRFRPVAREALSFRPVVVPGIVVAGGALSLLLFMLTHSEGRARLRAEHAAAELRRSRAALERANASLRESEARLRTFIDANIVGMLIGDVGGRIHEANDAFLRLIGFGHDDVGRGALDWRRLTAPEYLPGVEAAMQEVVRTGRNQPYEKEFVRKDGTRVPVLVGKAYLGGPGQRFVAFVLDISERKRAEASLRRSEDQLRLVTDSLPVLVAYIDASERYRFNNRHYEEWFGPTAGRALEGRTMREVLGDEAYAQRRPFVEAALRGEFVRFDGPTPHRDGTVRQTAVTYVPDRAADGAVRGFVSLVADVTAERRTAHALRRYADLFQHAELGLAVTAADGGTIEMANAAFARMCGLPPADLVGRPLLDAFAPEYRTEVPSHVRIARERGHHTFESTFRRDDAPVPVELDVTAVKGPDGSVVYVIFGVTDITERERAEAELRASEARKGAILETALDCIITIDHEGRVLEFNPAAERTFGYARDDVVGLPIADLLVPPSQRSAHADGLARYLRTGEGRVLGRRIEVTAMRNGGEEFPVELAIARIPGEGPATFTAHVRDITERKRDERERERLLAAERDARLQAETSRAAAEAANRSKDEFLATLSHELRTPLNAMLGWAQLLRMGNLDDEEFAQGLETIERNARAQAQLVEDLLDLSRIISGKLRLDVGPVDLPAVIEAALDSVRPAADAKGIRVIPVIDSHAGSIRGDGNRLQQVVWNLLSNAIKFTPQDGQVQIVLARAPDGQAEVSVGDTGAGIAPEFLPHVFDRLRQADATTTRKHGGLGLGLSIVRHLVELHGGTVAADSPGEGRGATFTVRLPVAAPAPPTRSNEEAAHAPAPEPRAHAAPRALVSLAGVRALVVDDEPDARELIGRILRQCGAEVTVASSAGEGAAALASAPPDVLLSDIGMPGEDGYSLIRRVRALPDDAGGRTPAIALTAFARAEDRARAAEAGFQLHVSKPVEPAELADAVARVLSASRSGQGQGQGQEQRQD